MTIGYGAVNAGCRVLYVGYPPNPGGAPHQGMGALWLAREGVIVDYFSLCDLTPGEWVADIPTLQYRSLPKRGFVSVFFAIIKLGFRYWSVSYDFVYIQGAQQAALMFWSVLFNGRSKVIYHTQDFKPNRHPVYSLAERFVSLRAHAVICNEINRARGMATLYRLTRMPYVLRTALPTWWGRPKGGSNYRTEILETAGIRDHEDAFVIIAGGPWSTKRMSAELLRAFAMLSNRFVLVFTGMEQGAIASKQFQEEMESLGSHARGRVVVFGSLDYSRLLSVYAAGDVGMLLYPNSDLGNFYQGPGRLTEYLRCGLPVIASDFPGLELLTLKYSIGDVADPEDPTAIAAAIRALADMDVAVRSSMRTRLVELSESVLAYEENARVVFPLVFK